MSTGQMAMTIGAFMLLGVIMMNFRTNVFESEDVVDTNTYVQTSVTIGRSLLEEIAQRDFDVKTKTKLVVRVDELTYWPGPGSWEHYPNFNDVDDFHRSVFTSPASGATVTSATPACLWNTEGYKVAVTVRYVDPENPAVYSSIPTWAKRVDLVITNIFSQDTVRMNYLATY